MIAYTDFLYPTYFIKHSIFWIHPQCCKWKYFILWVANILLCAHVCVCVCTVVHCSAARSCLSLCDPMDCSTPGLPGPHHLLEFATSSCPLHQWCHSAISSSCPLLLLPSVFPSIKDFPNELAVGIRWSNYWSFIFSISPSNEYSALNSFKIGFCVLQLLKSIMC